MCQPFRVHPSRTIKLYCGDQARFNFLCAMHCIMKLIYKLIINSFVKTMATACQNSAKG